jgi:hypothetical protein
MTTWILGGQALLAVSIEGGNDGGGATLAKSVFDITRISGILKSREPAFEEKVTRVGVVEYVELLEVQP